MQTANNWKDYELLDSGDGEKLERWGSSTNSFILSRPDPLAIWPKKLSKKEWSDADAHYLRSEEGGGKWSVRNQMPDRWEVKYSNLKFIIKPTQFKHTGLFPEQAVNWDWMINKIKESKREINVLNLFAYTGGATVAATYAGAKVCHVDSSKGIVGWAKENAEINSFGDKVRWIVDDAVKFVEREAKRGTKYDAIIMDPPSFGRGAKGEVWKIEQDLWPLIEKCKMILTNNPLFFLVNSYSTGMSPTTVKNILISAFGNLSGKIESSEIGLQEKGSERILPQGVFGRWEK
ncbi:MAG: class I SAM-dependent methyltransferase [bacterium]